MDKIRSILAVVLGLCMAGVQAQPGSGGPGGRGPGGPPMGMPGPGGPGGFPSSRGPQGPSFSPDAGPRRGGPSYGPGMGSMPSGPAGAGPYGMPSMPDREGPGPRSAVPTTRFGSIPNQYGGPPSMNEGRSRASNPPGFAAAPADTSRMQQALRQRDYATIGHESEGVRTRTERMERMSPELPVQDRLQIPLINHMYRQGADLMEEGRHSRDDAKIRRGIQQINQANEKLDRLHGGGAPRQ